MKRFIFRRIVNILPALVCVTLVAFLMMYILPGDPAAMLAPQHADPATMAQVRERYGLDLPPHRQFSNFIIRAAHGDLGESIRSRRPVTEILLERIGPTAQLAAGALLFAIIAGITAGALSAARPRTWLDAASMLLALVGVSMPVFWLGLMLIVLLAGPGGPFTADFHSLNHIHLRALFRAVFSGSGAGTALTDVWTHLTLWFRGMFLPWVALGSVTAAGLARLTRSCLLETLGRDFIRTARAKGVGELRILLQHGLRNALIPIVTLIGASLAGLLSGAVLTETVFNIPGIGREIFNAIDGRDYPVVVGGVLCFAVIFILVNLMVDLIYIWLDPRIRYD